MSRMFSLKTALFFLIVVVVGLTIVLISRCQSNPLAGNHNWNLRPLGYETKSEEGVAAAMSSYYQSVHDDDSISNLKVNNDNAGTKSRKGRKGGDPAPQYPFEDDFDNDNNNAKNAKKNEKGNGEVDDLDGYSAANDVGREKLGNPGGKRKTKESKANNGLKNSGNNRYNSVLDVTCDINHGKYVVACKKEDNEVYIPFSFIHKYFEVYGKMADNDDSKFIWLHSQAKIYRPKVPYDPKGVFTYFENYNVEVRDRVKCVSGAEGVPVSTQWDSNGYFYPIQIAQFGLSHYSKYLVEGEPGRIILENGEDIRAKWMFSDSSDVLLIPSIESSTNHIIQVQQTSGGKPAKFLLSQSKPRMLVLSWDMKLNNSGSPNRRVNVTITATLRYETQFYYLHYTTGDFFIKVQDNHIYHGLGFKSLSSWQHIIRDLGVDVQKGVSLANSNNPRKSSRNIKISKSKLILESISTDAYYTRLFLDNITLSTNEHLAQFFQAADWFIGAQDARGGWPIPVRRKFASDFYPVLESGWYSAMGQGHALSLLSRAYALTKNREEYAKGCAKAVESIFDVNGSKNGVRAVFMDKYVWYEEYPTTPSTFVLNGFMYALLGLYDVRRIGVEGASEKAGQLYDQGVKSLKTMLPLYDTGSGTMYDLRHFTVPGISPNLARLDYHVTHINQLLTFATFEEDSVFSSTAERWIGYTDGNRAPHN